MMILAIACSLSISQAMLSQVALLPAAQSEDFVFQGGGVELAGNLLLPPEEGPHPVIIVTHGSEPGSRRGYGLFADLFLGQGIAVMRYDKRGVGDSEGTYVEAPDLRVPCADLLGAVSFVLAHPAIDAERIGVFGASQGGWVAPMAASMSEHIRFVILQSAPGVSPLEQNLYDKNNQLRSKGLSPEDFDKATAYRRAYWSYLISGEGYEQARDLRAEIAQKPWLTEENFAFPFQRREQLLRHPLLVNWALHSAYEPRLTLERVSIPILAVFGAADSIVPVEASVAAFRAAFAMSGNSGLTIKVIDKGDHGIRVPNSTGRRVVSSDYLELMSQWAAEQAFD